MKVNELRFKGTDSSGYSFIRHCLFKDESWEQGAEEHNKEVENLIKASATTDEFVEKYLANTEWKKEQCYQAMLKKYKSEKIWLFIREMFGDKSQKTISDAGALKIGAGGFAVNIPNGYGDGEMRYAVLNDDEFYASDLMHYFTMISGKFNVYSYDCGDDILEELDGTFQVYFYEGLVALVRLEK